jgi:DHA1 family bicyclomycin/chloramphenicol resistance-like MFS transporter
MQNQATTPQKYLGKAGLVILLGALSAFPALSTDLYLPALPKMTAYFGVPEYQTNLTLILFFIFYAVALLLWGPLSDRFGRKPVVVIGMVCYTVAGALCAVSGSIFQLMAFRVLQAIGAAAASTVATAIVKDVYQGRKRETTLAVVQSMTVLAPLLAPILGGLILRFISWRGVFMAQGVWGILMLGGAVLFKETLKERLVGNPLTSLNRLGVVLKNRDFVVLLATFSLIGMAGMAFISSSSYIYEVTFGLSSQTYSYFFAMFGAGIAVGPPTYLLLSRWFKRSTILTGCFVTCAVSGILVFFLGRLGPWPFILTYFPTAVSLSCMRPPSTYLMLGQHEADAGSVSGIILATGMVLGSVATAVVSLQVWNKVEFIGGMIVGLALVSLAMWLGLCRPRGLTRSAVAED